MINANLVENYLGFPQGIAGPELVGLFAQQAGRFDIRPVPDTINSVSYSNGLFHLEGTIQSYTCNILVIASGTVPSLPGGFPSHLASKGLVHTDISALRKVHGRKFAVIGAGDAAFDYALSLAERKNSVSICNRGNKITALRLLSEKALKNKLIDYHENCTLISVNEQEDNKLRLVFREITSDSEYIADYLIFATGRRPALDFISDELKPLLDTLVSRHRLYLIGDVKNGQYRQLSLSAGDGVKAAMEIFSNGNYIEDRNKRPGDRVYRQE